MPKPIDYSKFRKNITKNISGISTGFNDPTVWVDTGCYSLNRLISRNFYKGVPLGKITMLAGESGSGKSFVASGNIVKNAQKGGIFCVLIDTENALDEEWLKALGVDTSEDKLMRISASMVDDVARIIHEFVNDYNKEYGDFERDERPEVLFVIDSLGMLLTPTDLGQFEKGDMKGDMGRKAKALRALVTNSINKISEHNIGIIATNHTYASQDIFDPEDKVSGGMGPVYASSIVIGMKKGKLKDGADVTGIKATCKILKSRYAKPQESVKINIPYEEGMDPYSGLLDMFVDLGFVEKVGNRYKYESRITGDEFIEFRKNWQPDHYHLVMDEITEIESRDGYQDVTDDDLVAGNDDDEEQED